MDKKLRPGPYLERQRILGYNIRLAALGRHSLSVKYPPRVANLENLGLGNLMGVFDAELTTDEACCE